MPNVLSRTTRGGGISKRSSGPTRVDRDGDLDMDGPSGSGSGRGGRGGGRNNNRNNNNRNNTNNNNTKGGKGRGGSGAGRSTRRDPVGTRRDGGQPLVAVRVTGWKETRGTSEECVKMLERKTQMKFKKTSRNNDEIIIWVQPAKVQTLLDWDNALFAGANLKITSDLGAKITDAVASQISAPSKNAVDTVKVLEQVLANRYNPESKFLDLSKLGEDPLLKQNGFFELGSTTSKMFPALMLVADKKFETAEQKRETVHSVSLAYNNLKSVAPVSTLAQTFPDLKNLSLEGNQIANMKAMDPWRIKFKQMEQLVLVGNPLTEVEGYRTDFVKRYPKLMMLDNVAIERPAIQIGDAAATPAAPVAAPAPAALDAKGRAILPLQTKGNFIIDEQGIAMQFMSAFYTLWDTSRPQIVQQFYDQSSTFSLSVNTSAQRVESQKGQQQHWESYISLSRNHRRTRNPQQRLAVGPTEITTMWNSLPASKHDLSRQEIWNFETWPIPIGPELPGLLAIVHGEFEETLKNGGTIKRSFDRTFTLRPDGAGVKVLSDILTVRSYSGYEAWKEQTQLPVPAAVPAANPTAPGNTNQQQPQGEDTVEQKQEKCRMLAEQSGLKLEWAEMCLVETKWDLVAAWEAFVAAKAAGSLGPEAWQNPPQQ